MEEKKVLFADFNDEVYDETDEDYTDEKYDDMFRPKKMNSRKHLVPLFTYLIIKENSSPQKHLLQKDIIKALEEYPYEVTIERKALSRILHSLEDSGLGIVSRAKSGIWYDPKEEWMNMAA